MRLQKLLKEPLYKSYLHKLSPSSFVGWQKRYFILFSDRITYYKNEEDYLNQKHPKGVIRFDRVKVTLKPAKHGYFDLELLGSKRIFKLWAKEHFVYKNWTTRLENVIFKSLGFKNDIAISN